jgi:hypothetical protein
MRGSNVHRLKRVVALVVTGLVLATCATACGPSGPTYVESTTKFTASNLDPLFESARKSDVVGRPTSDAAALRHRSLVELRGEGKGGASAADLITETFPVGTRGVPVHVQRAEFDGVPALMLLELIGPSGGQLDDLRLWVIDPSGNTVYSEVR